MTNLTPRLTAAISTLIAHFKLRPDGPYDGLSLIETSIVGIIATAPHPPGQGDVAQRLGLPKTTMASAVTRLEAKGHVTRAPSAADGRRRVLTLTASGRDLAAALATAQGESSQAMLDSLPAEDRETLVRLLERIVENLRTRD